MSSLQSNDSEGDKTRNRTILTKGTVVAHYRIVEKIGAGGMGEVYLADDTKLKRQVALKFLPSHLTTNAEIKERFTREAQASAKLNHPHIVTIHEVSEHDGRPFIVMEHVEGHTFHKFAHDNPQPIDAVIEYAIQICQGLAEAHREGIVHRDIKSANIAIDKTGRVRILDFGLAAVKGDEGLTKTGSTLGTIAYMSPEQVSGKEVDHRSDLFSLGIVLYEMLCGRTPFKRDNEGATLKAIMEDQPEPIGRYKSGVPERLQSIISNLLEKDKELRYQNGEGVIADLKKMLYDSQQTIFQKKQPIKKPLVIAAITTIVLASALSVFVWFNQSGEELVTATPVLAVLPFENLGSPDDEYFSDGITDEIISRLARVSGMRVISRTSSIRYKDSDKTMRQIGDELGANFILEGTIRWDKSGNVNRVRITPQLIQVDADFHLWAEIYERELTQIFEVQSDIANQIVTQLGLALLEPDQDRIVKPPTENMTAYDFYLRGIDLSNDERFVTQSLKALSMFDSAVSHDPDFALAIAHKSKMHSAVWFGGVKGTTDEFYIHDSLALDAANRARELSPDLPAVHLALGTYYNLVKRDYERALIELNKAKSEMVNNAELSEAIGIVKMRQGNWQECLGYFEKAIQADPLNVGRYLWITEPYTFTRDYEKVRLYLNRAKSLAPNNSDVIQKKVHLEILESGDYEKVKVAFLEGVEDVGLSRMPNFEFGSFKELGWWRFKFLDIPLEQALSAIRDVANETHPYVKQMSIAQIYDSFDMTDLAMIHYDSARVILEEIESRIQADHEIYQSLGMTYAFLGMKEKAIQAGQTGKEVMSVDECHW